MLEKKTVTLRTVAERVGLAPCSVSAVLNNAPASLAIPQHTKDRIFRAAAQLNYRPNYSARSLRTRRTHMVAVVSPDFGCAPVARVVAGMERILRSRGYLLVLGAFEGASEWKGTAADLQQRGIEGVLAVGASLPREVALPVVTVDLEYVALREPLTEHVCAWLTELGESAVEALLSKIESQSVASGKKVPMSPHSYFGVPDAGLAAQVGISAAPE